MFGKYLKKGGCKDSPEKSSQASTLDAPGSEASQQITFNPQSLLAYAAAIMLVIASAGFGVVYAWQTGSEHGQTLAALSVLMALGLEFAKPVAISGALDALMRFSLFRALALAALGFVAVAYSLTAELSLQATTRGDLVAERKASSRSAANVDADRERIARELAEIGTVRPSAAIQAELDALLIDKRLNDCEGWVESPKLRVVCGDKVAPLKAEHAKAERREKLEADLATLRAPASDVAPVQKEADPAAHALATYLAALGFVLKADVLSEWLALIPVLALEVGSAFAGLLVRAFAVNAPAVARSSPEPSKGRKTEEASALSDSVQGVHEAPDRFTVPDCPGERLVQLLRARGGEVLTGQRMLAKALGLSTGAVNALLKELADTGRVIVEAGRHGTRVRLAGVRAA